MEWIASTGGPLILLSSDAVAYWPGAYGPGGEDDIDEEETEYWRICMAVTDYADAVEAAGHSALVLSNGGVPTAFVGALGVFVQQVARVREPIMDSVLRRALPRMEWEQVSRWSCEGPGLLFDSAMYGPRVRAEDALGVDLDAGEYEVRCAYLRPENPDSVFLALTQVVRVA